MSSHIVIKLTDTDYHLSYREGDDILLSSKKDYGLQTLEKHGMRSRSAYLLLDPLLSLLEKISLYERIPTTLYVEAPKHTAWVKHIFENYPYTQFYTAGKRMSVILLKATQTPYAGHTQEKYKFKI